MEEQENQTTTEVVPPTYEELETQVKSITAQAEYRKSLYESEMRRAGEMRTNITRVKDYITENFEDWDDDQKEVAKEIADLLGIELTTTRTISVRVDIEVEVSMPLDHDFEVGDLEIEVSSGDYEVEVESYDIESIREV